jgi:hypothetical protein
MHDLPKLCLCLDLEVDDGVLRGHDGVWVCVCRLLRMDDDDDVVCVCLLSPLLKINVPVASDGYERVLWLWL